MKPPRIVDSEIDQAIKVLRKANLEVSADLLLALQGVVHEEGLRSVNMSNYYRDEVEVITSLLSAGRGAYENVSNLVALTTPAANKFMKRVQTALKATGHETMGPPYLSQNGPFEGWEILPRDRFGVWVSWSISLDNDDEPQKARFVLSTGRDEMGVPPKPLYMGKHCEEVLYDGDWFPLSDLQMTLSKPIWEIQNVSNETILASIEKMFPGADVQVDVI